ncbi:hypothetical protein SS1G_10848 [Sclerotinia sclerotiorum 1980 UF-70]|uniref:Uncharacterized protein n=1 Tax=Sclerotinia sclerotiorum (strain ATCC 18683 / 1980 / Ss-1) TaxID=665079 RepID=A7EZT1_SCLS1|nr:hypothetical protein SS1G_10848 [Sclerotinia sclerotiorum 1980 UF-70]EDN94973.1 hypothetical protein SS1G_10848 [Sclerotinia sclerotiorum 1980 UF-70]
MFDSYPGPKSFLLLVCKEVTEALRGPEPNPLALPPKLRDELPNLTEDLYPLHDCFSSKYISTLILPDGSGGGGWLAQFLTLRDITQFVVAASIQYTINRETRDAYLPAASERTRNAVLRAIENMRIPPRFSKEDLIGTFTDQYRIILPDTPDLRRQSMQIEADDKDLDAIDALCLRLGDRQMISRLDNPETNEVRLPSKTKCVQCEEPVTLMREMTLARQVWDLLEPFESHADAANLERHVPTYFQLPPPKTDGAITFLPAYNTSSASNVKMRTFDTEPPSPFHNKTSFTSAAAQDRSRSLPHTMPSQVSPIVGTFGQRLDTPSTLPSSSSDLTSLDGSRSGDGSRMPELRKTSTTTDETSFSPESMSGQGNTSPNDPSPFGMVSETGTYFVNRSALRIVNLQTSAHVVEHPLPSNLWASSIAISPNETTVAVGFTNATVHFFKTTQSGEPREDRLHSRIHNECEDCPEVETLSYSDDGMHLLASTRSAKSGAIQIYFWMTPMKASQELVSCRYHVPLHESEDRGLSSAIFRSRTGIEEILVCITTWTQSGVPILVHPKTGQKTDIKTATNRSGKLGSRIQCASFSPSGKDLAMVNEKGHLYLISALNSSPLDIRKIAVSRELTIKSDSFAMGFVSLPDEEAAIVMAWIDPSKAEKGMIRKIPLTVNETNISTTPVLQKSESSSGTNPYMSGAINELPGDSRPIEMVADEEPITKYRMMGFVKYPKK